MSTRKIEHLDEQTILGDNDLVFTSVSNGVGYDSKKVTLASIANYVRSTLGSTGGNEQSTVLGYETYDTSESGDGVYTTAEEVQEYCDDPSKNYLWDLLVGRGSWNASLYPVVTGFEKTFHKDCAIYIWNIGAEPEGTPIITIDGKTISTKSIAGTIERYARFYVKSGQTLKIDFSQYGNISVPDSCCAFVTIIPLRSGGIFFDTNNNTGWRSGQASSMSGDFVFKNTEQCKVLFTTYGLPYFNSPRVQATGTSNQPHTPKLNEKYTHLIAEADSYSIRWIILNPGDEFAPLSGGFGGGGFWWNSYPLLEDGSGSGCNSLNSCSCGYEMYDTSENTDGTYNSISEYENSSNNYAWYLEVPRGGTLTKTVTKDCVVWIDGVGGQDDYNYNWSFYINNVKIYTFLFRNNNGGRAIYVKRGQELKLETQTYPIKLSVIPLASGGQFFIDTSIAPERGTLTQNFTYEATRPTLFAHDYVPNVSQTTSAKINGKNVVPMEHGGYSHMSTYYILKTGDILTTVTYSNAAANYAAYALLVDGGGSGGNVSSSSSTYCNCGNPIFFDSQESDNYVWEPVYEANSTEFTKIATHDCVAIPFAIDRNFYTTNNVADADNTIPLWRLYEEVRIDDLLINPVTLALANNNSGNTGFYLKKGQKLNVKLTQFAINRMINNIRSRLKYQFLPITNGGTFVDTDKMKALMRDYPEQYVDSDGNWKYNNATYQDGVPFSFPFSAHVAYYNAAPTDYVDPMQAGENREQHKYAPKIDEKYVQNIWWTQQTSEGRIDINLKANQTLEIYSNYPGTSIYFNIRSFACVPIMDNPSYASYEDLNVQLIDNHDSNVIDLEVTQSPENSTITYFVSSNYETSNASWQSLLDNRAAITFSSQTDRDKKYVFFKVSQNGSDSIYMMQLMQSYYATQSAEAAYDIKTVNLGYAGYQSSSTGNNTFPEENKNSAKTYLLNQLPSMQSDGYTEIYNNVNADWDGIGVVQRTNADNFMTMAVYQRTSNGVNFNWVCKVRKPQTSSGAYTYLHSIILQLSYFGD